MNPMNQNESNESNVAPSKSKTKRGYQKRLRPKQIRARKRKQEAIIQADSEFVIESGLKFIKNWQPTSNSQEDPTSSKQSRQSEISSFRVADITSSLQPSKNSPS